MTKAAKSKSTKKEREEVLHRIWLAQANALAAILEETPAKDLNAAVLNTARQFLADQGVATDTWSQEEDDAAHLKRIRVNFGDTPMPKFDDHYE